jgi:hypothetical protein
VVRGTWKRCKNEKQGMWKLETILDSDNMAQGTWKKFERFVKMRNNSNL